jgi:cytochrome c biogenesis protein CcmG, thiol:disulfide interchange protein DsbE
VGRKLKFLIPVLLFALLIGMFYKGLYNDPTLVPSPFIGKQAPAFSVPSLQNPAVTISNDNFAGRVALLNVWASWCPGCASEHALLLQIANEGIVPIYGLNWKDERPAAMNWLQRLGNPYTLVAYDYDNTVGIDWGVYGAPETFLIDADGVILHKLVGPLTPEIWATEFLPLIEVATRSNPVKSGSIKR